MSLDLRNRHEILSKYNQVIEDFSCNKWLILDYEGNSNKLKVGDYGDGGIEEMVTNFNSGKLQYGIGAVPASATRQPKIILIQWQGDGVPLERLAVTARHASDLQLVLRGVHAVITARSEDDVDLDSIEKVVSKLAGVYDKKSSDSESFVEPRPVGSVYRPIKPNRDIDLSERDQFWKKVQQEEADRLREEEQRAAEKNAAVVKEREELNQRLHEKLVIEEQKPKSLDNTAHSVGKQSNSVKDSGLIRGRKQLFEQKANELRDSQIKVAHKTEFTNSSPAERSTFSPVSRNIFSSGLENTTVGSSLYQQSSNTANVQHSESTNQDRVYVPEETDSKDAPDGFGDSSSVSTGLPSTLKAEATTVYEEESVAAVNSKEEPPLANNTAPSYYEEPPYEAVDYNTSSEQQTAKVAVPSYYEEPPVESTVPNESNGTGGTGLRAVALWDYQAADDTEISFDPDDVISEIDQIDEGWWRGRGPDGRYGLFPANYVSLIPN